jgi:ABC-type polysaccharide/polyol phosphate export permease
MVNILTTTNKPIYDSDRQVSHALSELRDLKQYQYLLKQLVRRDILTRYKRSVLGVAWTMLNPLGTMLILSFVFSNLFKTEQFYSVYILTGIISWNFFSQGTNAAMSGLMWGGSLMKQIYVPRTIFGVSAIGTALVNLLLSLIPLMLVILITGAPLYWTWVFVPISIFFLVCFTLGFGLIISTMAIYFPDVSEMYQVVLSAWFYLTPIVYPESIITANIRWLFLANPMYFMVKLFRLPIREGLIPTFADIWPAAAWGIGTLIVGWLFFTSKSDEYAYRV